MKTTNEDAIKLKKSIIWLCHNIDSENEHLIYDDFYGFCKFVKENKPWLNVSNIEFETIVKDVMKELAE